MEPMSDWREKLLSALEKKGLTMKAASVKAGLNAAAVQQIKEGNDPKASTLQKLAESNQLSLDEIFLDQTPRVSRAAAKALEVSMAPVVGQVAAGLWFDGADPPHISEDPIPYVLTRYKGLEQKAYKVVGSSMDKRRIADGDYVICVDYWAVRLAPQDGDVVVVERKRDGGLLELTVKELVVFPDRVELTPRSTDPQFTPIVVARQDLSAEDHRTVEIVGLVIGCFTKF